VAKVGAEGRAQDRVHFPIPPRESFQMRSRRSDQSAAHATQATISAVMALQALVIDPQSKLRPPGCPSGRDYLMQRLGAAPPMKRPISGARSTCAISQSVKAAIGQAALVGSDGDHGSICSSVLICSSVRSAISGCRQPVLRRMWIARGREGCRAPDKIMLA